MRQWRMRTTLMVSLLAVSLGLTATCLLIIRVSVQQQIREGLKSDLEHSLVTFRNISLQRNQMLAREAALLADLPSLKALMATQDANTIQDGSLEFWRVSGSDFFALVSSTGELFTYSSRGSAPGEAMVRQGLRTCMVGPNEQCMIAFGQNLYELSMQPLFFGPSSNGSQLGYVVIGYAVDQQVAKEVSEAAAADVAFLVDGEISATTLSPERLPDLRSHRKDIYAASGVAQNLQLGGEKYIATSMLLADGGRSGVQLVVLKSYDRASDFLKRVNRWVVALGFSTLLIGGLLAAAISRTVTRPLEALVAGTRALGQGDFHYQLSMGGAVEVRELGLAFERMRGELKQTQESLIESDRLATIGRMASSVSHDLRHHLSAIYANAEFMSLGQTRQEERLELLEEVKDAVQGMTDLIESLVLFSQTGHVLHLQHESIALLMERTVHMVRQHPEGRDIEIRVVSPTPVEAWVDGRKLGRAIYNLLLNACQAAKRGRGRAEVVVTLEEDGTTIMMAICDTGPGVPSSIRRTLFQPFVSEGKENGVGLGLTLAQHIAQEHGGEVRLEESHAGRTVFSIVLRKEALQALGAGQAEINQQVDVSRAIEYETGFGQL